MSNCGGILWEPFRQHKIRSSGLIDTRSDEFAKMRKYIREGQQSEAIAFLASNSFSRKEKLYFAVMAVSHGAQDVIDVLLDDSDVDATKLGARLYDCGGPDMIRFLLSDSRIDCTERLRGWFIDAVQCDWVDIVSFLILADYIDPSMEENVAISIAARLNHCDMLQVLLSDKRVHPSANHNKAFIKAIKLGHREFAKMLFEDERFVSPVFDKQSFNDAMANADFEQLQKFLRPSAS